MGTIQVLLVGGRQTPNVIGVLLLRPTRIELVVSSDEANKVDVLLESLKGIEALTLPRREEIEIVDAYDFQSNIAALERIYSKYHEKTIQFNLTGSTKIMALAAYEIAKQNDLVSFYINTAGCQIMWITGRHDEVSQPFKLTIEEYLNIFGRRAISRFKFENFSFNRVQAISAATLLAASSPKSTSLLQKIKAYQSKGRTGLQIPLNSFDEDEQEIINDLANIKVLDKKNGLVILRSNNDFEFFKGGWLEIYVYNETLNQKNRCGHSVFNECCLGLEIPAGAAQKEIDVACISEAQLIHCSCKTDRDPFKTLYLDEIRSISSMIGGRFCSRIFVTNAIFPDKTKQQQFLDQAKQREIVVITGKELSKAGEILSKQAKNPDFWRV